jgi:2-polyprenyl-3-methyl-5-hydroxy-6-metoxy-1,4-benzoquinol methylase
MLGVNVIGVDVREELFLGASMLAMSLRLPVRFEPASIGSLTEKFGVQSFDVVFASEVLEHLADPIMAVRDLVGVLKPQGVLVVSVPYEENIIWHECIHCGKSTPAYGHLHAWTEAALIDLLSSTGVVQVIKVRKIVSRVHELPGVARMLGWMPHGAWSYCDRILTSTMVRVSGALFKPLWMVVMAQKHGTRGNVETYSSLS